MRNLLLIVLLLLAGSRSSRAQQAGLPIQVDVDEAVFAYDSDHSLLEVYLAFAATDLPFQAREGTYIAELPLRVSIHRESVTALEDTPTEAIWADDSAIAFAVQDTSVLEPGNYFVHQFRALLRPGEYELRVVVPADEEAGRSELEMRRDLSVDDFATERVALSDATLAVEIRPSDDRTDPFYKSGYIVRPNANRLFGADVSRLFYYVEVYHPDSGARDDETYSLYAYVAEANRTNPYRDLEQRNERRVRSPDVVVGSFDLSDVPSGSYFLHLVILGPENEAIAETTSKLFVYNPNVAREATVFLEETFETSEFASMPEEQVEQGLSYARLLSNDQEQRRMRALEELDDKRRFLMDFWKARDPDPATPQNEYRQELMQRIEFANQRYGSRMTDGFETDQGRVLVRYGHPAQVEPHLYDRELLPHEIWRYNNIPGEGQAVFVFADRSSFGRFELIHSSVAGERSLPNWESELRRR